MQGMTLERFASLHLSQKYFITTLHYIYATAIYAVYAMGGWWRWALVSPDGVAPSRMVGVFASLNLPLHHKVQKFSSGTGSPG